MNPFKDTIMKKFSNKELDDKAVKFANSRALQGTAFWMGLRVGYTAGVLDSFYHTDFQDWLRKVKDEQKNYPLFNGIELDEAQLRDLWKQNKTPIDALNDLSTVL